eukprot:244495-Amphidinium_carterae.1
MAYKRSSKRSVCLHVSKRIANMCFFVACQRHAMLETQVLSTLCEGNLTQHDPNPTMGRCFGSSLNWLNSVAYFRLNSVQSDLRYVDDHRRKKTCGTETIRDCAYIGRSTER